MISLPFCFLRRLTLLGCVCSALMSAPLHAAPTQWTAEIDALTARDATMPPPQGAVLFVGSSSIRMWEWLHADFPGLPLIQRGFGGSELADSVFYADRIVLPYRPRTVVLYAGENDIANGKKAEVVAADFAAFVAKVRTALPATRILYVSIKPSPSRASLMAEYARANALIATACARDPALTFVDVYHAMLGADGQPRPELFRADKLHLNHDGYAIWVHQLDPLLRPSAAPLKK